MKGSYGQAAYGIQAAKGAAPGSWAALGLIDRPTVRVISNTERINAVGDWNARELSEGMASAEISLSIVALQNLTFLGQALRDVNGELPWLSVRVGHDKGADEACYTVEDCKIDSFTFRCDAGGRPSVDVNLIGGDVTKAASACGAQSWLWERSYRYFELIWSEAAELLGIEFTLRNNLDALGVIAGSATTRDPDRIWDYLEEGQEEIDGNLIYYAYQSGIDAQECLITPTSPNLQLVSCEDASPDFSAQINFSNLKKVTDGIEIPIGGNIAFPVDFMAEDITFGAP
jgi:hypothetical protein